jgi:Retrotransposon gag protein
MDGNAVDEVSDLEMLDLSGFASEEERAASGLMTPPKTAGDKPTLLAMVQPMLVQEDFEMVVLAASPVLEERVKTILQAERALLKELNLVQNVPTSLAGDTLLMAAQQLTANGILLQELKVKALTPGRGITLEAWDQLVEKLRFEIVKTVSDSSLTLPTVTMKPSGMATVIATPLGKTHGGKGVNSVKPVELPVPGEVHGDAVSSGLTADIVGVFKTPRPVTSALRLKQALGRAQLALEESTGQLVAKKNACHALLKRLSLVEGEGLAENVATPVVEDKHDEEIDFSDEEYIDLEEGVGDSVLTPTSVQRGRRSGTGEHAPEHGGRGSVGNSTATPATSTNATPLKVGPFVGKYVNVAERLWDNPPRKVEPAVYGPLVAATHLPKYLGDYSDTVTIVDFVRELTSLFFSVAGVPEDHSVAIMAQCFPTNSPAHSVFRSFLKTNPRAKYPEVVERLLEEYMGTHISEHYSAQLRKLKQGTMGVSAFAAAHTSLWARVHTEEEDKPLKFLDFTHRLNEVNQKEFSRYETRLGRSNTPMTMPTLLAHLTAKERELGVHQLKTTVFSLTDVPDPTQGGGRHRDRRRSRSPDRDQPRGRDPRGAGRPFKKSRTGASSSGGRIQRDFEDPNCRRCGLEPHSPGRDCPAKRATCHSCKESGHFGGSPLCCQRRGSGRARRR